MLKNSKLIIIILISLITVLTIPIILDWLIIGNNFPSNISNPDWVNFFGGYIGAIMGAIATLIGIIITLNYTRKLNRNTQELQVGPYCIIRFVPDSNISSTAMLLGYISIGCEPRSNNGPRSTSIIYVKNIGLGPAIEFKFEASELDDGREHYISLLESTPALRNRSVNHLQSGEEAAMPIIIYFNFDPITEDDFTTYEYNGVQEKDLSQNVFKKYKNFDLEITMTYFDIFRNEFVQKIKIGFNMSFKTVQQKSGEYICTPYKKEVTSPIKSQHAQSDPIRR